MIITNPTQKTNKPRYSYHETLAASQKANWRLEDIIGGDKRLGFAQPFMPESFARVEELSFLTPDEKLKLNQIRGFDYLCAFGLVEEFILPFVLDHARQQLRGDDYCVRAFLAFTAEEAKHIHLFKHFRAEFENGFGTECLFIGPPSAIAEAILAHDPLAVTLVILHIEWMTQKHYTESVQDDRRLDAQFKSLLKHHWMEEAQHAKLDTLMVEALAEGRGEAELEKALDEYLEIGGFLDNGLRQQAEFNLENLRRSTGRRLTEDERVEFVTRQHQALRWTFLGSGMTHPNFLSTLEQLSPALRKRLEQVAPVFC
ncbi:MAG TPA: hypothetical protein VFV58_04810 [Blastocatellia bacterium]|jgi:hypothetical protein|nr:hypothetical protein [Blastocatellia bacterium]